MSVLQHPASFRRPRRRVLYGSRLAIFACGCIVSFQVNALICFFFT